MFDRMIREHGYSIRKLAEKLGKDKGYLENRLRLADAPEEIRELVSLRKDTLSHAYELLKVDDPKKRKRLAAQVASRRAVAGQAPREDRGSSTGDAQTDVEAEEVDEVDARSRTGRGRRGCRTGWTPDRARRRSPSATTRSSPRGTSCRMPSRTSSPSSARRTSSRTIPDVDRANLAKYLTIAKLKLENAIALVRTRRRRLTEPRCIASTEPAPRGAGFLVSGPTGRALLTARTAASQNAARPARR